MEKRIDFFSSPKCKKLPNGFLQGDAIASRAGVFKYYNADGSLNLELRHPDEVFKADSLETLKMLVITDDHPRDFVSVNNAELQVGFTGENIKVDNDFIITPLTITNAATIKKIEEGKSGLSYGYTCVTVKEDGVYNGVKYTHKQLDIKYNHLSIVDDPRAGDKARIRLDDAAVYIDEDEVLKEVQINNINNQEVKTMSDLKTDEKDLSLQEVIEKNLRLEAENNLLKMKFDESEKKVKTFEQLYLKEKQRKDEVEKQLDPKAIDKLVEKRTDLFIKATALTGLLVDSLSHYSNDEIRRMVLKHDAAESKHAEIDAMQGDYLIGTFDFFCNEKLNSENAQYKRDAAAIVNARHSDYMKHVNNNHLNSVESKFNNSKRGN